MRKTRSAGLLRREHEHLGNLRAPSRDLPNGAKALKMFKLLKVIILLKVLKTPPMCSVAVISR